MATPDFRRTNKWAFITSIIAVLVICFLIFFFVIKAADNAEPEDDRVVSDPIPATVTTTDTTNIL